MTASAKSPRRESITCFDAERFEQRAFARAAGAGDHFRAEMMRDLDRRHSDAARAGVDENAFALAQARHVLQRVPRSHENDRQSRCRFESRPAGMRRTSPAARQRVRGKAEDRETENAISRRDVRHARDRLP